MLFVYPDRPHVRRHGPVRYTNYKQYKPWLRDEFTFRCVYCLVRETWYPNEQASFSADHFVPQVFAPDRVIDYENLVYACTRCNSFKRDNTVLDPSNEAMSQHLRVQDDGTIVGMTSEAREHIQILGLDDPKLTRYRKKMLDLLKRLQRLPAEEVEDGLIQWFGYPEDLPDLRALKPPGGNTRPEGITKSYYTWRKQGALPLLCISDGVST